MNIKLFAAQQPSAQGWLEVGDGHRMYWQTSGNPEGIPVVWLHGGPGSASSPLHRRFLDPARFWIIQYDQRGCGRSLPSGAIKHNETSDLMDDIERLREHLSVQQWCVVGGSWGGALALLYAQTHPARVLKMLCRSPFLCTKNEIDTFMQHPPEACAERWRSLQVLVPNDSSESLLETAYQVFCVGGDADKQVRFAKAWLAYEGAMNVYPAQAAAPHVMEDHLLVARYKVLSHYLWHRCFVGSNILLSAHTLLHIPLTLVHGDMDALCPYTNSLDIQTVLPQTIIFRVDGGGHDLTDPGMLAATFRALSAWDK